MSRQRKEEAGADQHAFARGVNRKRIFLDDEDYERYIRMLRATVDRYGWELLALCLLPNHAHLLIRTPEPNLGAGMQWLQSGYALSFNERHGHRGDGHVFQGPYGSRRAEDVLGFMRVAAYVVMNAVVAGLCTHPAEWPWSSHGLVARGRGGPWLAHERFYERMHDLTGAVDFVDTIVV